MIGSILRSVTRNKNELLNILSFPTHERYQTNMARTGHNFYLVQGEGIKTWTKAYGELPSNIILLNPSKGENQIPNWINYDLVLSQNKFGQIQVASQIARKLHLPLISLEHTLKVPGTSEEQLLQIKQLRGHTNVFISEYSRNEWLWIEKEAIVIKHGIDTELFQPDNNAIRSKHCLSVVNDWKNRNWCCGFDLWQQTIKDLPFKVLGDNPGLSKPASSLNNLVETYQKSRIFLNTSLVSPVPTSLMEAMACGCACVSTSNCMIPEVIKHGVNGFLANTSEELREFCQILLEDEKLAEKLGEAARKTIVEKYNLELFVNAWDKVFRDAANIVYRGE